MKQIIMPGKTTSLKVNLTKTVEAGTATGGSTVEIVSILDDSWWNEKGIPDGIYAHYSPSDKLLSRKPLSITFVLALNPYTWDVRTWLLDSNGNNVNGIWESGYNWNNPVADFTYFDYIKAEYASWYLAVYSDMVPYVQDIVTCLR